jgi:hypothetical protein
VKQLNQLQVKSLLVRAGRQLIDSINEENIEKHVTFMISILNEIISNDRGRLTKVLVILETLKDYYEREWEEVEKSGRQAS